jgi:hypothetical protein
VTCCHKKRVISEEQTPLYIQPTFIYFPWYLHIITTLYIYIIWHLKCLYSFGTFGSLLYMFCLLSLKYVSLIWLYIWQEVRKCSSVSTSVCVHIACLLLRARSAFGCLSQGSRPCLVFRHQSLDTLCLGKSLSSWM